MTQAEFSSESGQADLHPPAWTSELSDGGEMGERIRAFDWASTPLGPVEQWPQSLLTLVTTAIHSRFPIVIWWDRIHYTTFYNDAYIPALGKTKHPVWLGRSGKECWSDIWSIVGPMLESVFETGQPTWSEDLLLIMDRNLPREETYFTFSYSAILGKSGSVGGIFCACTETTERVIGERRLQTLRDLASSASQARSAEEACERAARLLTHNTTDIPFALIYLLDRNHTTAHLVAHSGVSVSDPAETRTISLLPMDGSRPWPLDEVAREATPVLVSPLPCEWGTLPAKPWPEPANSALVLPMLTPSQKQVTGLLVLGVNPRRELDASYRDFFQMVAGHVATAVANARAYVEEALRLLAGQEAVSDLLPDPPLTALPSAPINTGEQQPAARILFADDNADMRQYVSRLFHPRYSIQVVPDGNAALRMVKESPPDLVLADVMMPGMDGFALLHALRSDEQTRHIPVILLSARAGEEAQIEGMDKGADDYLIKPFSARELLARVGAHLEMARLRKETQERIEAERQRLHDLFMQAPAVIVELRGPDHVFELANPLALQLFGLHRSIIGKSLREVLPELQGQDLITRLDTVYQTGQPFVGTEVLVHIDRTGDGTLEERYFNFVYQPSSNASGDIDGIMIYANEVTEQVKARQQREDLLRQKDDFIGVASHELKTPVTSLKGFAQLLERRFRRDGDTRSADLLHKMDMQLTKLARLVEDLLDVTKIENGQLRLHYSLFDYNTLITEVVEEIQRATPKHRIVLELRASATLFADRDRLGQILTNLLTNAIKYSPQADTVLVKTRYTDEIVVTSVQDFGIGIPTEKQSQLFERFYRVEGDHRATYPGLGLGLYITAAFVAQHHGEIWVQSTEGQGSTFSFSLPQ